MKNKLSHDILNDALTQLSTSALEEIEQHCKSRITLALHYADDVNALQKRPDFQQLRALRDACSALRVMK